MVSLGKGMLQYCNVCANLCSYPINLRNYRGHVYICDSPFIALTISLIIDQSIDFLVICEVKSYDREDGQISLIKRIIDIPDDRFVTCRAPDPWNRIYWSAPLKTLVNLRVLFKEVSDQIIFGEDCLYYGSVTSSLLFCAPPNRRVYMDHGFVEPMRRFGDKSRRTAWIRAILNSQRHLLKTPPFDNEKLRRGYSPALFKNDSFWHVDFSKVRINDELGLSLAPLIEYSKPDGSNVFGLMSSSWHNSMGFPSFDQEFLHINFEMIRRNTCEGNNIFIKFHRQLYVNGFNSQVFVEFCKCRGLNVIDVDKLIPSEFLGIFPVELLIRVLGISKIFGEVSGAFFSLSHFSNLTVIMDHKVAWKIRSDEEKRLIAAALYLNKNLVFPFIVR